MNYILKGHNFINEIQTITQVFFPNERFVAVQEISKEGITVLSALGDGYCESIVYDCGEVCTIDKQSLEGGYSKTIVKLSMFMALQKKTGMHISWGTLTGIRPSKIVHSLWREGYTDNEVIHHMADNFLVDTDKIRLCIDVARAEQRIIENCRPEDFSLYIGIPFCPSKCLYCSFTSFVMEKHKSKVNDYLQALTKEIDFAGNYAKNRHLEAIYIGGGTPTALDEGRLERLLYEIEKRFDISGLKEYTVEAGRPDTITWDKLVLLKRYGVTRISINPQTMNDKTLQTIGRSHTVDDFIIAYNMARKAGHNNINVDLILGLPGETPEQVLYTMSEIYKLAPENCTVHTLSVKRASKLKEDLEGYSLAHMRQMEEMLDIVGLWTGKMNMQPYYMYRQKNMLGNFENVGYCKEGYMGIYNVQIMEERQNVLALGAGAVTKMVDLNTGRIERIFNVKDLDEYIKRIDEMLERKGGL